MHVCRVEMSWQHRYSGCSMCTLELPGEGQTCPAVHGRVGKWGCAAPSRGCQRCSLPELPWVCRCLACSLMPALHKVLTQRDI